MERTMREGIACFTEQTLIDPVHTQKQPFCKHLDCWCHTAVWYHRVVMHPTYSAEEIAQAHQFYLRACCQEGRGTTGLDSVR